MAVDCQTISQSARGSSRILGGLQALLSQAAEVLTRVWAASSVSTDCLAILTLTAEGTLVEDLADRIGACRFGGPGPVGRHPPCHCGFPVDEPGGEHRRAGH